MHLPTHTPGSVPEECNFLRFRLGQISEREPTLWFELLVASILSSTAEHDIRSLNPYLSSAAYKTVNSLTVVAMLASIRIGQSHRAVSCLLCYDTCSLMICLFAHPVSCTLIDITVGWPSPSRQTITQCEEQ